MKNIFYFGRPARDGELSTADQINRTMAATSWNFQASAAGLPRGTGSIGKDRASIRAFRALSQNFFDAEAKLGERVDGAIFALIMLLAAWPLAGAAHAIFHLIK